MIVQSAGGKTITVPLKEWGHDLNTMASRITKKTRMIFIANPNNPTGTINTAKEMETFMKKVPDDVLVILDEAYYEYVTSPHYADSMKYFRGNRDILILRTFSKIYGLAGLRIGYGIAKTSITSDMNRIRQPFNTNALAQRAALAALKDEDHLERAKRLNEGGKKYLYRAFKELGIHYIPTEANFIYVILDSDSAPRFYNELLREGIIVRPMGLRELRITIGLPKENKRFIEALKSIMCNV
ncbi:MAG: aminotransferase class I/II-fold pyridoxal phosphate-dependent enzyme [Nitrospiraceae bacterium]|nr:MAG: aminotransferase class I/II-fold pyridoxal phosphate-dependent enzyme [Nitrospiraceae bacterium]